MEDPRFIFPFGSVRKGAKIVIYGGGIVGKTFLHQVARTNHCQVVVVCDRAPSQTGIQEVRVVTIPELMKIDPSEYETVVIANELEHIAESIRIDLEKAGIPAGKIQWHNPARRVANKVNDVPTARVNNVRLPYLKGAESKIIHRPTVVRMAVDLMMYDVVSFDIFDTLILRPLMHPVDLFRLMESRLGYPGFYNIRRNAEQKVREKSRLCYGNMEVTLADIWKEVEYKTGIPASKGMEVEIEYEMRYCLANPYMKKVFDILIEQGKTVIIVSDMYLTKEPMERLLKKAGYEGYEKLYISCEYHTNKRSGGLYEYVKRDYEGKSIIHVGDNTESDIQSARRAGLSTKFYQNVHDMGNRYRTDGLSRLIESTYDGLVNVKLHNGVESYSPYYEYGYIYGGLYIFGFCQWIHRKAQEEGVEKILFVSRDGAIYQKVFSYLFSDMATEYLLWSRICSLKYFDIKHNRADFLRRIIRPSVRMQNGQTVGSFLEEWKLTDLKKYLLAYDLEAHMELTEKLNKPLDDLLIDHWDEVEVAYEEERRYLKEYLAGKIGTAKKIAVIDIGWAGSGTKAIKYLLEKEYNLADKVFCWQAAHDVRTWGSMQSDMLDGTIESYLFTDNLNKNCFDVHTRTNRSTNNIYMEIFTQDTTPSFGGYGDNGECLFDIVETENYEMIREVHKGIFDFCKEYNETFAMDSYLYNVSGYDAYMPIRFILRNLSFFKNNFGNMRFARFISGNSKKQLLQTISQIMKRSGL